MEDIQREVTDQMIAKEGVRVVQGGRGRKEMENL